jgi:hypothetical protein
VNLQDIQQHIASERPNWEVLDPSDEVSLALASLQSTACNAEGAQDVCEQLDYFPFRAMPLFSLDLIGASERIQTCRGGE